MRNSTAADEVPFRDAYVEYSQLLLNDIEPESTGSMIPPTRKPRVAMANPLLMVL